VDRHSFEPDAADYACREAATAMALAVQSLVRKAVQHPEFAGLLAPGGVTPAAASPPPPTQTPAPVTATPGATAPTATPPPSQPVARLPVENLHDWAPGRWRSTGGTNTPVIDRRLRWLWDSSAGGKWSGSGEIHDGRLILRGWHSTSIPMSLRLGGESDRLVGELQTSRSYPMIFLREP
jgi:hypothetical protein